VDIAVVCATHRKLKAMIAQGLFREDLYYRLNGVCLNLPPLRERTDAALVAERILQREVAPGRAVRLSESVSRLFRAHPWPGNLRQLHNVLRTAVAMAGDSVEIRPEHLPEDFLDEFAAHGGMAAGSDGAPQCGGQLRQVQWTAIVKALERSGGNVSATARELGISRNTIYRQLKVGAGRISA
jgi:transcriptional regulator of acetoin/glycerol metabolism